MENPIFIGKVLQEFDHLNSTNDYALKILSKSNPPEGTVISTYNQSHGRGQIGSNWESSPGRNLTLSVILYPKFLHPNQQFHLNKAMALAIRSFLSSLVTAKIEVKWPNDLLANGKKLGGILIQNNISNVSVLSSVLGIGINVNQKKFNSAPNAISLSLLKNDFLDLNSLRTKLFSYLEKYYFRLKSMEFDSIDSEYIRYCRGFGEEALYQDDRGLQFLGTISGIGKDGKLEISTINGIKRFGIKEIQRIN